MTVGKYDSEEHCRMIGKCNQSLLERANGFMPRQPQLILYFKNEITTNLPQADSVDETFNLVNNIYCPREKKLNQILKKHSKTCGYLATLRR